MCSFPLLQLSLMAGRLHHLRGQAMEAVFLPALWKVSRVPPPLPWYSLTAGRWRSRGFNSSVQVEPSLSAGVFPFLEGRM